MSARKKIVKAFHMAGQDEKKIKIFPTMLLITTLAVPLMIFVSLIINWKQSNRITRLKLANDLNISFILISLAFNYSLRDKKLKQLLDIIDSELPKLTNGLSDIEANLVHETNVSKEKTLNKLAILTGLILINLIFIPAIKSMHALYTYQFKNGSSRNLPLPAQVWYPDQFAIESYLIIYVLQCLFYVNAMPLSYCTFGSLACSFKTIVLNIKLFCTTLNNIDDIVSRFDERYSCNVGLRDYTKYIVRCHREILRYIKMQTAAGSLALTVTNISICCQMCVFLFLTIEVNNNIEKIGLFISVVSLAIFVFVYCDSGQNVINGGAEIRKALYESSWLNKPEWFKRDLRIMMIMANRPLHVKPYGFYIVNLNSFTSVMNAAYTYFNMLRTFRK